MQTKRISLFTNAIFGQCKHITTKHTYIYIFAEVAHIEGDWTIVDNFRLFYLGTDIPDAIDNVNDRVGSFAEASDIRTINGLRVSAPVRGINIVRKGNSYVKVIKMKD